jgi:ParB/RepB/Spo0J family partition protein
MDTRELPLDVIDAPANDVRLERDEVKIAELAGDIAKNGQINAITVIERGERFECETGWTRVLAMRSIHRLTIRALIRKPDDGLNTNRRRFAENLQRADLSPIEEARELARMVNEEKIQVPELASIAHRTQAWIEQRLALLDIPEELQVLVHNKDLALGAALVLAQCTDEAHRRYLTNYATLGGATVSSLRTWVAQWAAAAAAGDGATAPLPPMPDPGQPITITIPCFRCGNTHDYRKCVIVRICPPCIEELAHGPTPAPAAVPPTP